MPDDLILMHTGVFLFMAHLAWQRAQTLHATGTEETPHQMVQACHRRMIAVRTYDWLRAAQPDAQTILLPTHILTYRPSAN